MDKVKIISRRLKSHGAKSIFLFGSYARKEERKDSDIDILVDFSVKKSLFELLKMERELSEEIETKVDLVTRGSLDPRILKAIDKEKVAVA
jgi:uncharacterized protein